MARVAQVARTTLILPPMRLQWKKGRLSSLRGMHIGVHSHAIPWHGVDTSAGSGNNGAAIQNQMHDRSSTYSRLLIFIISTKTVLTRRKPRL